MITEIAQIHILPGTEADFEAAVAKARPLFIDFPGCLGFKLWRSVEQPLCYRCLIDWQTLETHTIDFRQAPAYAAWRAAVSPSSRSPPTSSTSATSPCKLSS